MFESRIAHIRGGKASLFVCRDENTQSKALSVFERERAEAETFRMCKAHKRNVELPLLASEQERACIIHIKKTGQPVFFIYLLLLFSFYAFKPLFYLAVPFKVLFKQAFVTLKVSC